MNGNSIRVGGRYRAADRGPLSVTTWEVLELFQSKVDHIVYARLGLVGDPSRTKSLSARVLEDTRHFAPEPSDLAPADAVAPRVASSG